MIRIRYGGGSSNIAFVFAYKSHHVTVKIHLACTEYIVRFTGGVSVGQHDSYLFWISVTIFS